ncbi:MAG: DUF4382 domain-containing protein [Halobacteriota archaeon]
MVGLAGCLGDGSNGTLPPEVIDQPGDIADVESCIVTIVGMWLGSEGPEAGDEGDAEPTDREYYEYDEAREADLVELQGENTRLADEREPTASTYESLQLDADRIDAPLEDGRSAPLEAPGEAPLSFNQQFEVRENTPTVFAADFTPVKRGQTKSYVLQPVPDGITVEYEHG